MQSLYLSVVILGAEGAETLDPQLLQGATGHVGGGKAPDTHYILNPGEIVFDLRILILIYFRDSSCFDKFWSESFRCFSSSQLLYRFMSNLLFVRAMHRSRFTKAK